MTTSRSCVLVLGANSDVAKEAVKRYVGAGKFVVAASRSTNELHAFVQENGWKDTQVAVRYFDAVDFASHQAFYDALPQKPETVLYAAGYLVQNEEAIADWSRTYQMINVHYAGAVSILNIIISDTQNTALRRIIGLSSLSGVRGRKSNFIYGSTKSAFTQYLAGLRQWVQHRDIVVNVVVAGYIRSKMVAGLPLKESLMLEPAFIADAVINAGRRFVMVPGWKWKIIYQILRILPESLVAKLP